MGIEKKKHSNDSKCLSLVLVFLQLQTCPSNCLIVTSTQICNRYFELTLAKTKRLITANTQVCPPSSPPSQLWFHHPSSCSSRRPRSESLFLWSHHLPQATLLTASHLYLEHAHFFPLPLGVGFLKLAAIGIWGYVVPYYSVLSCAL